MQPFRECAITGYSIISALGNQISSVWDALAKGHHAIKRLDETRSNAIKVAGFIDAESYREFCGPYISKKNDRTTSFSLAAVSQLIQSEQLNTVNSGIILGTGYGTIDMIDQLSQKKYKEGQRFPAYTLTSSMNNSTVSQLSIQFGFKRYNTTLFTACSSGINAIGLAYRLIKHGYEDSIMVVGVESGLSPSILESWASLRAASPLDDPEVACCPFSINRSGVVLGEGAAAILIESKEHAIKRNAKILAEIVSYSTNIDGFHITQSEATSQTAVMKNALTEAKLDIEDIDLISVHGTSTPLGDKSEYTAIYNLFNEKTHTVPINALKSQFGHTIAASGVFETIFSIEMMNRNTILPTIHYTPDPEINLNVITALTPSSLNVVLKNSFAFGGNNACIILKKPNSIF